MPARLPRRTLGWEIAVTMLIKAVALAAIGLLLFGPESRPHPAPAAFIVGASP